VKKMKSMNRKESKKIAVMAAVIVGLMMFAFMPFAAAGVTDFTVTPSTGIAGAVDSYNVLVTTTGVTTIEITIPAGFIAVAPTTGGVLIAEVNFWNSTAKAYYGSATITANDTYPTKKVDIDWELGGETATTTGIGVDYAPGKTNVFTSGFDCDKSSATIKLPTETLEEGYINITIDCSECPGFSDTWRLDDVHISIKQFVRNPLTADDYDFIADGVKETVSITAPSGRAIVVRGSWWYADTNGDHICDVHFAYGLGSDTQLVGDVNQDGVEDVIIVRDGWWFVDTDQDYICDDLFKYGAADDIPLVGDINQDGATDTIRVRDGWWFVDTDYNHAPDIIFPYGDPTDKPLVGAVNQDGKTDTIVVRDGLWIIDTDFDHVANVAVPYGDPTKDIQLAGDIDLNGKGDMIVVRNGLWIVDTDFDQIADYVFPYGLGADTPLVGVDI
jgi:hypothetical protein